MHRAGGGLGACFLWGCLLVLCMLIAPELVVFVESCITSCGLVFFVNVFLFVGCVVGFCWSGSSVGVEEGMVVFVFLNCEISIVVLSISVVVLFLNSSIFVCSCFISCICRLFKCCFLGAWSESSVVIFVIYD